MTVRHLPNPQGQTHSTNYFKVNSFYCLRKEFVLAVFPYNRTIFLLRNFKTIPSINIFHSGQFRGQPKANLTWTVVHLFLCSHRLTASLVTQDVAPIANSRFAPAGFHHRWTNLYFCLAVVSVDRTSSYLPADCKAATRWRQPFFSVDSGVVT